MQNFDVIIVGGGLGGLLCGAILSKEGINVCVVEKNQQLGGCLQIFGREKCIFNTGLNYVEGLEKGQNLYRYFSYFGLMDKLKLRRMDIEGFDRITFHNKEYKLAQGENLFIETLAKDFPNEKKSLKSYIKRLKEICNQFPLYNLEITPQNNEYAEVYKDSAYDYIESKLNNKILQNIVAGNNLIYAGVKAKTPLYIHALITYSFIGSAWRLVDGSYQIPKLLADNITHNGGKIFRNKEVKKIIIEDEQHASVELKDGNMLFGKTIISNIHPSVTVSMLNGKNLNKAYRNRLMSLKNSISFFSLYIVLKENTVKYMNYNHYYYSNNTVWTASTYSESDWPQSYMLYTPPTSKSDTYAQSMIVISYMKYNELKKWENTNVEHRGEDYLEFKKNKAELLIRTIEKKFPGLRKNIKNYYTSTPLTYRDYTATPEGSAYGIQKDYHKPFSSLVSHRTKIPNLLFTGQNLNVHGILGVTISAILTCSELVGFDYLLNKIRKH